MTFLFYLLLFSQSFQTISCQESDENGNSVQITFENLKEFLFYSKETVELRANPQPPPIVKLSLEPLRILQGAPYLSARYISDYTA